MLPILRVVALGAALALPAILTADEPKPGQAAQPGGGDIQQMFKQMAEANKPGPMHEWMKVFIGEWDSKTTFFGMDGKPALTGKGVMTYKPLAGGRYISMHYKGEFNNEPFEGGGTMGYCNAEKRFEATWYDSMGTDLMMMTGNADKDGKVLTLVGESPEPDGTRSQTKEVLTFSGKDAFKSEFFMLAGGQEIKAMEITYTRKTGGKDGEAGSKSEHKDKDKDGDKAKGHKAG